MQPEEMYSPEPDGEPELETEIRYIDDAEAELLLEKPKRKPKSKRKTNEDPRGGHRVLLVGIVAGALYGLVARLLMGSNPYHVPQMPIFDNNTMTYGFLVFVPFAIGVLSVALTPRGFRTRYGYAALMAVLTTATWLFVVGLIALEALICLVMAIPVVLITATLGALLTCWV